MPVVGGIAMSGALLVVLPLSFGTEKFNLLGLYLGIALIAILGVLDDRAHVSALWRLSLQGAIVMLTFVVVPEMTIDRLGNLTGAGPVRLGWMAVPFTLVACVGVMNAINMVDGVDGLAGLFAVQLLLALGLLAADAASVVPRVLPIVMAVVLGFLAFNLRVPWRRRASVFMGDAGSLMLGLVLTWCAVGLTQAGERPVKPIVMVWLFGLPLLDTVFLMLSRAWRRQNPLAADRRHFHHFLFCLGLRPGQTALAWNAVASVFIGVGLCGHLAAVPSSVLFYAFVTVAVIYAAFGVGIWRWVDLSRYRAHAADHGR